MFNSVSFLAAWSEWKEHYEKKTLSKYSEVAERKAQASLFKKCDGREDLAIQSIDYSIEKNWSAIYIKPMSNGNGQINGSVAGQDKTGTSTDRVEALRNW